MDSHARLLAPSATGDGNGRPVPVPGLYGTGLGFALQPEGTTVVHPPQSSSSSGGGGVPPPDFTAEAADGVSVYLKRAATLILAGVLGPGPRLFGEGATSWEQRGAANTLVRQRNQKQGAAVASQEERDSPPPPYTPNETGADGDDVDLTVNGVRTGVEMEEGGAVRAPPDRVKTATPPFTPASSTALHPPPSPSKSPNKSGQQAVALTKPDVSMKSPPGRSPALLRAAVSQCALGVDGEGGGAALVGEGGSPRQREAAGRGPPGKLSGVTEGTQTTPGKCTSLYICLGEGGS